MVFGFTGRVLMEVAASETINNIKTKIHNQEGIAPYLQRLLRFDGGYRLVVDSHRVPPTAAEDLPKLEEGIFEVWTRLWECDPDWAPTAKSLERVGDTWAECGSDVDLEAAGHNIELVLACLFRDTTDDGANCPDDLDDVIKLFVVWRHHIAWLKQERDEARVLIQKNSLLAAAPLLPPLSVL